MAPSDLQAAALPDGVTARRLREADIADAVLLSEEAGWNQVAADWRIFLDLGEAFGLMTGEGRLIATAAILPHGDRFGWISMVLVTAAERRRGHARWLLRHCIAALLARRLVPVLDATPAGRAVYLGLGFEDSWSMRRLIAREPLRGFGTTEPDGVVLRPLDPADWPALIAHDRAVFGGDRSGLLRRLAERLPSAALVAERQGRMVGFLLGRDGRIMSQLGPLVAEDDAIAQSLLARAFSAVPSPLAVDLADRHARLGSWLAGLGFAAERSLTRMVYRRAAAFDDTARLFAPAGPELG